MAVTTSLAVTVLLGDSLSFSSVLVSTLHFFYLIFHAYNPLVKMPMFPILVIFMACHIVSCSFGFYLLGFLSLHLKMYVVGTGSHLMTNYRFKIAFLLISSNQCKVCAELFENK